MAWDPMIDCWGVFTNVLWIAGLATALSIASHASWLASLENTAMRAVARRVWQRPGFVLGLTLVCLGAGLSVAPLWQRILWFALAAGLLSLGIWIGLSRRRDPSRRQAADTGGDQARLLVWLRLNWRLMIGLTLSAVSITLAVRRVSLETVREVVAVTQWNWVIAGLIVVVISSSLKAVRWQALFYPQRLPLARVWSVYMVGQMLNAVLPARAGEVGRILLIGQDTHVSSTTTLSTVAVEKVVDLILLVLAYLAVAVWLAQTTTGVPDWLQSAGQTLIPLSAVALAGVLFLARYGRAVWQVVRRGLKPLTPRWRQAADSAAEQLVAGLEAVRHNEARVRIWGLSLVVWILMAVPNYLVMHSLHITLSPFVAVFLLVVLMSGVAAPPLPGNLGVFAYLCVLVLSLFGVSREVALVYGVTLQAVAYLPPVVLGTICLLWENWGLRRVPPGHQPAESGGAGAPSAKDGQDRSDEHTQISPE